MTSEKQIPIINQFLPIQTVSEANRTNEHWTVKSKRHRRQQALIKLTMPKKEYPMPCLVVMTRLGGRLLDSEENLPMAFKWIKDELSDIIVDSWDGPWKPPHLGAKRLKGRNDSDPRIEWRYAQETKGNKGIRIDIYQGQSE